MNEKAVALWLAALRSGKIKQTRLRLGRDDGSRCCLGVACDVAVKAGIIDTYDPDKTDLPLDVTEWLGLTEPEGRYRTVSGGVTYLVSDNDFHQKTFEQIADIIESKPEGLFREAATL